MNSFYTLPDGRIMPAAPGYTDRNVNARIAARAILDSDNSATMKLAHVVSMSGGKDSTATRIVAMERGIDVRMVFADTGHEHAETYRYLEYLESVFGTIETVRADFTRVMEGKRRYIAAHWYDDLTAGRAGTWEWRGNGPAPTATPDTPANIYRSLMIDGWKWRQAIRPWTPERARAHVAEALEVMHPTGNAFLDLCIWKGRFPSTRRRFCSEELKAYPIRDHVYTPLNADGYTVVSWQGVRADESANRAHLDVVDQPSADVIVYRPIITWTADDVFEAHRRHGIKPNPLYTQGMGRVGCMPCIHASKREIAEIARRWPKVIDWLERMETEASKASKYSISTFGDLRKLLPEADYDIGSFLSEEYTGSNGALSKTHGIRAYVKWAQTSRGGRQQQLDLSPPIAACSSIYHLCESAE